MCIFIATHIYCISVQYDSQRLYIYASFFFFFKQKTAYEMQRGLVGSEMCIRDRFYIIKQYSIQIFQDELALEARVKKKIELYKYLKKETDYVCEIVDMETLELTKKINNLENVTCEIWMKSSGKDLMSYRNEANRETQDLINVVCLSAMAIGTVHHLGIFHGYIFPKNLNYDNSNLQLLGFDIFSQINSQRLIDNYRTILDSKRKGFSEAFFS
eukprot:TRINITY_DN9821_c0_g1_i1.p1 TRINITY_DN9821_c0_g1~~TRINITY_DN9821_c0_g1_i1.p1  ORF type:complete len:214 (+),score=31.02 TRINITY_DN9821_c0_g1_i1:1-642(+)